MLPLQLQWPAHKASLKQAIPNPTKQRKEAPICSAAGAADQCAPMSSSTSPAVVLRRRQHSNPLIIAAAIVFTALAIVVLLTCLAVLAVYLIYQPKAPYLQVASAQLTALVYDQSGVLDTAMDITVAAVNSNLKTDASFSELRLVLAFNFIDVAVLQAADFSVPSNATQPLNYAVQSSGIPLDSPARDAMDASLKNGQVTFSLAGQGRTRWRVGPLLTVKVWTHLNCQLTFLWPGGAATAGLQCSSNAH